MTVFGVHGVVQRPLDGMVSVVLPFCGPHDAAGRCLVAEHAVADVDVPEPIPLHPHVTVRPYVGKLVLAVIVGVPDVQREPLKAVSSIVYVPVAVELHSPSTLRGAEQFASSVVVVLSDPLHVHVHIFDTRVGLVAVPNAHKFVVGAFSVPTLLAVPHIPHVCVVA